MSHQNETPAQAFFARHVAGDVLDGTVASVVSFGAFVVLVDGVHGLLHKSEWNEQPELGVAVRVKILAIDADHGRLSLRPA
jgi:ribosomal protein S1